MSWITTGTRTTRDTVTYLASSYRGVIREVRLVFVVPFMARVGFVVCHLCTLPLGRSNVGRAISSDVGCEISHHMDVLVPDCRGCCWCLRMNGEEDTVDFSHVDKAKRVESIGNTTKK